jgi:PAS domain S-box-containing protein
MMKIVRQSPLLFLWTIVLLTSVEMVCAQEPLLEPAAIQSAVERSATRDILNKGLVAIPAAEKAAIINQWSSLKFDHGIRAAFVWTWVLIVVIGVSGILLLFLLWTKSLKKQVQNRTFELYAANQSLKAEISGRKRAGEALANSESKYRDLIDNSLLGVFDADLAGKFSFVNDALVQMYDFDSTEQMLAIRSPSLWANPEDREQLHALLKKHGMVSNYEAESITHTGRRVNALISARLYDGNITGMVMDISKRKHAEERLQKSESKYRTLLENLPQKIFLKDRHSIYISCNENYARDLGILPEEIAGKRDYDFFSREIADKYREDDRRIMASGQTERLEEQYVQQGKKSWVVVVRTPVLDDRGAVAGILGTFMDVTEQKRVKDALLESEEKFRTLVTNTEEIVYMVAKNGTFLLSEGKGLAKLGLKPEQVVGKSVYELYKDYPDMLEEMRRTFNGETVTNEVHIGSNYFRSWFTPHKNHAGEIIGLLGLSVNITEQKQAEEKLQEYQQRLKSLAVQLTLVEEQERRRIAEDLHDHVGQSLALARMQLAAARKGMPHSDIRDAQFDDISQSLLATIQDTRHLIFELSAPSLNELGLAAAISEWMDENVVNKHGIEAEIFDHAQELPLDSDLRAILFRNVRELLSNAIKHARAKTISVWLESRADSLDITIQDDGVGFDYGKCRRSGDDCGGFGLFSVRERMSDLGGKLTIASQPGAGCRAVLFLPMPMQKLKGSPKGSDSIENPLQFIPAVSET